MPHACCRPAADGSMRGARQGPQPVRSASDKRELHRTRRMERGSPTRPGGFEGPLGQTPALDQEEKPPAQHSPRASASTVPAPSYLLGEAIERLAMLLD